MEAADRVTVYCNNSRAVRPDFADICVWHDLQDGWGIKYSETEVFTEVPATPENIKDAFANKVVVILDGTVCLSQKVHCVHKGHALKVYSKWRVPVAARERE